jgi:hypothetical protein
VGSVGRAIGLDVHRDFCEVAVVEDGDLRSAGRIATTPEALELFAQSLAPTDRVALEVTGSGWEIERILRAARRAGRGGQPGRYRHRPGQGAVPGTRHKSDTLLKPLLRGGRVSR